MKKRYVKNGDLYTIIYFLNDIGIKVNWLFVTIDSYYGDMLNRAEFLNEKMRDNSIQSWPSQEGLWIPQDEVAKEYVKKRIIVPFSAGFIFKENVTNSHASHFHDTTEREEGFSSDQVRLCHNEIIRLGALGYAADGCGLQCLLDDETLERESEKYSWK